MSSSYTLRYFEFSGIAEPIRLMLLASKSAWTEVHPGWPQEKPNQPFGRLPVLVEKYADGSPDFIISESGTIERYLAHKFGFFPSDPKKAILQEQLRDQLTDIMNLIIPMTKVGDISANVKLDELFAKAKEVLPEALKNNGSCLSAENNELTYIDFFVYSFFKSMMPPCADMTPQYTDSFESLWSPEVIKLVSIVNADPRLQSRMAGDKDIFNFLA
ncbi:hypothetical protein EV175_001051 [Coemansia sp. RSA 1933]|nr:hypothetical protein EV175_001051 [Coemansia sp. RSA 1933]